MISFTYFSSHTSFENKVDHMPSYKAINIITTNIQNSYVEQTNSHIVIAKKLINWIPQKIK
jgi:hypothetical protein